MPSPFLSRLPLSRTEVDRDYLGRDDVTPLVESEDARFLVIADGLALLAAEHELALLSAAEAPKSDTIVYLGRGTTEPVGTPYFAVLLEEPHDRDAAWGNLRALGAVLSDRDAGLLATRFSPLSGAPTRLDKGGWVLRDSGNDRELFPRTDMAVIVGVQDADGRLLLGSNAAWESNRYSLLAGFVEPGESLEAAVAREVFEESGMRVTNPVYLGSQPWPFPASLMLGFMATVDEALESTLTPDGQEILDLRWFSREELHAALDEIKLPGSASIARAIIEEWYGGPLEVPPAPWVTGP
jgi:NAD+ diphosphatase